MKRAVVLFALVLVLGPLWGEETVTYEPYQSGEFPTWAYELRRGETIFFGSWVITFPAVALGWHAVNALGGDLPTEPAFDTALKQASVACCLSLGIALADWIIGKVQAPHAQTP